MHFLRMGRRRLAWLVISIGFVALVGVAPVEAQPGLQDCIYTNYQAQGCIEKWTPKPGQRLKWNLHRVSGRRAEAGGAEVHHIWRPPTK